VLEKGGLADARFAMCHRHAVTSAARAVQQPVAHLALAFPASNCRPDKRTGGDIPPKPH